MLIQNLAINAEQQHNHLKNLPTAKRDLVTTQV